MPKDNVPPNNGVLMFWNWKFLSESVKKCDLSFNFRTAVNFVKRTPLAAGPSAFFI